jgi:hypothetical protein
MERAKTGGNHLIEANARPAEIPPATKIISCQSSMLPVMDKACDSAAIKETK